MTKEELDIMALRVLNGEYGNGADRIKNLGADYEEVQNYLNARIIELTREKERKNTSILDSLKRFVKALFFE